MRISSPHVMVLMLVTATSATSSEGAKPFQPMSPSEPSVESSNRVVTDGTMSIGGGPELFYTTSEATVNAPLLSRYQSDLLVKRADFTELPLIRVDEGYLLELQVGTPPEQFKFLPHTGTGDSWLMGPQDPDSLAVKRITRYDPRQSASFKDEGKVLTVKYSGDSTNDRTKFRAGRETLYVAGKPLTDVHMGIASTWTSEFDRTETLLTAEGIIALGPTRISVAGQRHFVLMLMDKGLITRPQFTLRIIDPLWADSVSDMSVITLGGDNPAHRETEYVFTPVVSDVRWMIAIDSVSLSGEVVMGRILAHMDSGTNYIIGPAEKVHLLVSRIPGVSISARVPGKYVTYQVPCQSTVTMEFLIARTEFKIPVRAFMGEMDEYDCDFHIIGSYTDREHWLFGLVFFYNVLVNFVMTVSGEPSKIGLAMQSRLHYLPGHSPEELEESYVPEDSDGLQQSTV